MPLVLDGLRDAISGLELVLERTDAADSSHELDEVLLRAAKSGVTKHFEFTYELSWRFIRRWLETNISRDAADGVTRQELFRLEIWPESGGGRAGGYTWSQQE